MNKKEAIEKIKNIETLNIKDRIADKGVDMVIKNQVLTLIERIDEPQKPVIPKFVAEWIEAHKGNYNEWNEEARADFVFRAINDLFRFGDGLSPWDFTIYEEFSKWTTENAYEFITAILFGYEVEKEKLYTVEIPNPNLNAHVVLQKTGEGIVLVTVGNARWRGWESSKLTESEIKKDFQWAWQFANELIY